MASHRWALLGGLGLLAGCATAPLQREGGGVVPLQDNSFIIESRAGWPAPLVERSLNRAVAFCAATGSQTEVQSSRVDPGGYSVVFRCIPPGDVARAARPGESQISRVVLSPQEASPTPLVLSAPLPRRDLPPEEASVRLAAIPPMMAPAGARALSPGNPFAAPAPTLVPIAVVPQPVASMPVSRMPAPAMPVQLAPPPAAAPSSGLPGATVPLGAVPPASFWQMAR